MTNLTAGDNAQPSRERTVPYISRQFTISLSGATAGSVQLPEDVKSAVIRVSGAAVQMWPSYNDGVTDLIKGVEQADDVTSSAANAATQKTIKDILDGSIFQEIQEIEFNKINAVIPAGTGSATVYVYPGGGKPNDL